MAVGVRQLQVERPHAQSKLTRTLVFLRASRIFAQVLCESRRSVSEVVIGSICNCAADVVLLFVTHVLMCNMLEQEISVTLRVVCVYLACYCFRRQPCLEPERNVMELCSRRQ